MKKWRNKNTGEINEFMVHKRIEDSGDGNPVYAPFDGNIDEWEDYEEPKGYWYIAELCGGLQRKQDTDNGEDRFNKQIGNYFETKEEAEKAVERLRAWKRLKDKGFEFRWIDKEKGEIQYAFFLKSKQKVNRFDYDDLDLLFSGEDD